MGSELTPAADPARQPTIEEALRRCMEQAPVPFAITRGPEHALVYANSAFIRLPGFSGHDALAAPVVAAFAGDFGRDLQTLLDRSFHDAVELLDERIGAPGETAGGSLCSVWPVVDDEGRVEALGVRIHQPGPSESTLELQRQIAEQMLLGALREHGFAEDAEPARRHAAFLAEAGRLLSESVDQASTFVALAKLALPALGSWCIMDVLDTGGEIQRLGI